MVTELPRFGRWATTIREFETPYGKIGYRQLEVLWALRHNTLPHDHISPSHISAHFGIQPSVVTRVLARLESQAFIDRITDPLDGRRAHIRITEKGIHLSEVVEELFMQEALSAIAFITDDQVTELQRNVDILTRVISNLEANRNER